MSSILNTPLWTPKEDKMKSTSMYDFMKYISKKYSLQLNKYNQLHKWSVEERHFFLARDMGLFWFKGR